MMLCSLGNQKYLIQLFYLEEFEFRYNQQTKLLMTDSFEFNYSIFELENIRLMVNRYMDYNRLVTWAAVFYFFAQGRDNALPIQIHTKILFSACDNIGDVERLRSGKEYVIYYTHLRPTFSSCFAGGATLLLSRFLGRPLVVI